MAPLLKAAVTGAVAFAATNVDDIFVLTLFFAQAGRRGLRPWHVVAGQYLGFAALVAISLVGYFARYVIPPAWLGLLGLVPIAIGLKKFFDRGSPEDAEEGRRPGASVLTVAAVTFANGGDNIGIYTPLFAATELAPLAAMLGIFFGLIAVWCAAGQYLGRHPAVARALDRYGHVIVPFVLMGLGLYIMAESGTLGWIIGY